MGIELLLSERRMRVFKMEEELEYNWDMICLYGIWNRLGLSENCASLIKSEE